MNNTTSEIEEAPPLPCHEKLVFPTRAQAQAAATLAAHRYAGAQNLKVYKCPHCGAWHLSSN